MAGSIWRDHELQSGLFREIQNVFNQRFESAQPYTHQVGFRSVYPFERDSDRQGGCSSSDASEPVVRVCMEACIRCALRGVLASVDSARFSSRGTGGADHLTGSGAFPSAKNGLARAAIYNSEVSHHAGSAQRVG